jgi:tRNA-specific 2-thiouridylase
METPVGTLTKQETRARARRLRLETAETPESVEICFVPDGDYVQVLRQRLPADAPALVPGPVVSTDGEVLGEHDGFAGYTIGQRRRLPGGRQLPLYVVAVRPGTREVVVGSAAELQGHAVTVDEVNWLGAPLRPGDRCRVQLRYRGPAVPARVRRTGDRSVTFDLDIPVRAIAPGQSGAFYDEADDRLLGGGVIREAA